MTAALLLSPDEVAALLGLSAKTVRRWAYGAQPAPPGFPAAVKLGRLWRWRRADLESCVASLPPARGGASGAEVLPPPPPPPPAAKRERGRPRKVAA